MNDKGAAAYRLGMDGIGFPAQLVYDLCHDGLLAVGGEVGGLVDVFPVADIQVHIEAFDFAV